ncbi:D-alanine--D-alanine ligase family protein [Kineococcus sp. SYSU DK004]|uniref:D-alanine--D-alanine ligase family protein n=1 Tax=Kineococcus sp. SYSU DK004 TaxID=3383125 RepID=UPI003D7E9D77
MSAPGPRVAVLAGGLSHERDVSVRSGRRVAEALRAGGCEVSVLDADAGLLARLRDEAPDVVWPALHGAVGEDGALRDVLGLLGLPYVGSGPAAARLAWDKPLAAAAVAAAGVAAPESVVLEQTTFRDLGAQPVLAAVGAWTGGRTAVVKPAHGGSALGVTVVDDATQLARAVVEAFAYDSTVVVQRFVAGTEVAVSVVDTGSGPEALPAVEVVPDGGRYDYAARYTAGPAEFFAPARLDESVAGTVAEAARTAHTVLGLRHLSRVDLVVDVDGLPWFLEANVAPGTTETSLLPQAVEAAGRSVAEVYRVLVDAAFTG